MSLLSSLFGGSKKVNLTPAISVPDASSAPNYGSLSQLAKQRINAGITGENTPGVGFGDDFVNKSTNPIAKAWQTQFQQETAPAIRNAYSSKGKAYSSLAADAENKAFSNTQNAIDQLMAQFYTLNEQQKKADVSQGISVGQNQDANYLNQGNAQAAASERLANATASDARTRESADSKKAQMLAGAAAGAITGGFTGGGFTPVGALQGVMSGANNFSGGTSGVGANILGGASDEELLQLLSKLKGIN